MPVAFFHCVSEWVHAMMLSSLLQALRQEENTREEVERVSPDRKCPQLQSR